MEVYETVLRGAPWGTFDLVAQLMAREGLQPDVRLFNVALANAPSAEAARAVLARLQAAGLAADAVTYNAALSAGLCLGSA